MSEQNTRRSLSRRDILVRAAAATFAAGQALAQSRSTQDRSTQDRSTQDRSTTGGSTQDGSTTGGSTPKRSAAPFDVERFIDDCKRAGQGTSDAQASVREVMARAMAAPAQVLAGVGAPEKGGIKTLYRSADLTILNIVWAPLMQLLPHEHNMWSLIGIYTGREDNIFWQRNDKSLAATRATAVSPGIVVSLPRDVIHSVANPIEKLTGAIHIYGGDFFATPRSEWDPETLTERPWKIQEAVRIFHESNERFFHWRDRGDCPAV